LRFNRFPVAGVPQPPLAANNVFVVTPDQAVHLITNSGGLQKFFHDALRLVETPDQAVTAGTAWLRLLQELHQDGFFRFNEPNVPPPLTTRDVPPSNIRVIGTLTVLPDDGDSGQISTTLYFNRGRLAVAEVSIDLKSGIRPVCQLTDTFPRSSGTSAHPSSADSVTLFAKSFGSPMASPCRWPSAAGTKTSSWRRPSN
jgi:hypothetical protein